MCLFNNLSIRIHYKNFPPTFSFSPHFHIIFVFRFIWLVLRLHAFFLHGPYLYFPSPHFPSYSTHLNSPSLTHSALSYFWKYLFCLLPLFATHHLRPSSTYFVCFFNTLSMLTPRSPCTIQQKAFFIRFPCSSPCLNLLWYPCLTSPFSLILSISPAPLVLIWISSDNSYQFYACLVR